MEDNEVVIRIQKIMREYHENIAKKGEALSDCDYRGIALNAIEEMLEQFRKEHVDEDMLYEQSVDK